VDTRTGVNDLDYQVPFRFNGKIHKLPFDLGPVELATTELEQVHEAIRKSKD